MSTALTSATGQRLAASGLQRAGLLERDAVMRDANNKPGGRKGPTKTTRAHRTRDIDTYKQDRVTASRIPMSAARSGSSPSSGPMAIRGASKTASGTVRPRRLGVQGIIENGMTSRTRPTQHSTVELWRNLVKRRYNADIALLNLENLAEDEEIVKLGLHTGNKEYAVMFKLAAELQPPVQSLSLANNAISSGSTISALSRYLPNIVNLSLQNNKLERHRDLDYVSGRKSSSFKLQRLRELILIGNPLRENEASAGKMDLFRHEIARRIPSLEMLDNSSLIKIAFDAPQASSGKPEGAAKPPPTFFPAEMMPGFISTAEGPLVQSFLGNFLKVFDQDRAGLEVLYHPSATFSFSANTTIPTRSRLQGFQHSKEMPHQTALEWGPWLNGGGAGSRNLSRVAANPEKAINSLHVGPAAIIRAFQQLPKTVHTIEGHVEDFSFDAWLVGEGSPLPTLFVNVHGQFTEMPCQGIRSFDRTFILTPAPQGSPAQVSGAGVMILSEQLCVRAYSSPQAWAPGPMCVQAGDPIPPLDQLATIANPDERRLVVQVSQRTGLTVAMAAECLRLNDWDIEAAVARFEAVKHTLPKDNFL